MHDVLRKLCFPPSGAPWVGRLVLAGLLGFGAASAPANTPPTITAIADQTITQGTATAALPFTLGDAETPAANLTLVATTDNPTLIPITSIVFGGAGSSRTVKLTPAPTRSGTAHVRVRVNDADGGSNSVLFLLTVNGVNQNPTITAITDQVLNEDTPTAAIPFTIGDAETSAASLSLVATTDTPSLIPIANIVFGGTGANRTVKLTPAANQFGTAHVRVRVNDASGGSNSVLFLVTVKAVNDLPTITAIPNQTINQGAATAAIPFTIGDVETAPASLSLVATTDNPGLIPIASIVFGGAGANRTVQLNPVADHAGTANVRVRVNDADGGTNSVLFTLTVNPGNRPPTISAITNQALLPDQPSQPITFTIGDPESPAADLAVSATCDNPTLFSAITFGGAGAARSVTLTPAAGKVGTSNVRIWVKDPSAASGSTLFKATVSSASITSFTASPATVAQGQSTTLSWTIQGNPVSVTLDGMSVTGLTSQVVHPRNVQTYTLVVTDGSGPKSKTLSVAAQGLDVLAGDPDGSGYRDGALSQARFGTELNGLVSDSAGNVYLGDLSLVRMISADGHVTTLAGSPEPGYVDGPGTQARFRGIYDLALDEGAGQLYITDTYNNSIRVLDLGTGNVSTLLGGPGPVRSNAAYGPIGQIPQGTSLTGLSLDNAYRLALDAPRHRLYVTECWGMNADVLAIDLLQRTIETYAGRSTTWVSRINCARLDAWFLSPFALTLDPAGDLYVQDYNLNRILRIDAITGWTSDIGPAGYLNDLEWNSRTNRLVLSPTKVAGVATLQEVDPTTGLTAFVAGGQLATSQDGLGAAAGFTLGYGICVSPQGIAHVLDDALLRRVDLATGQVDTLGGHASQLAYANGKGDLARFNSPALPTYDPSGNLYVTDGPSIRRITPAGEVSLFAGHPSETGEVDAIGGSARFNLIAALASDGAGNLYALDQQAVNNNMALALSFIRKISPDGSVSTLPLAKGSYENPPRDGQGAQGSYGSIQKLTCDASGNLYFLDSYSINSLDNQHTIQGCAFRQLTPAGTLSTLAGSLTQLNPSKDGTGSAAGFGVSSNLVTCNGKLFFADYPDDPNLTYMDQVLRSLDVGTRMVQTLTKPHSASDQGTTNVDGPLSSTARFGLIDGLAINGTTGDIYLESQWDSNLRRIRGGQVTTLLRYGTNTPAPMNAAGIAYPTGIAVSPSGNVVYTSNGGIVQITAP